MRRGRNGWSDPPVQRRGYGQRTDGYDRYSYSFNTGSRGRRGILRFSRVEKTHLLHAVIILSMAFGIHFAMPFFDLVPLAVVMMVPAVLLGFLLHEIAHKYYAQKFGAWSEFRAYYNGLLIALVLSPYLLFAAPGAVMISGYLSRKERAIVSMAGPMTNLSIAIATIPLYVGLTAGYFGSIIGEDISPDVSPIGVLASTIYWLLWINILLAGFNLIPLGPLVGAKVLATRPLWWVIGFAFVFFVGFSLAGI